MGFRILFFQIFVILESFFIRTVVLYNDIFIIFVRRLLINRIHTTFQIFNMIFIWDDDGDQRIIVPQESGSVKSQKFSLIYFCSDAGSVIMLFDGTFACLKCIGLAFRILSGGIFMASPMIENLGYMIDL